MSKANYLYSVGLACITALNPDGSFPTACDWDWTFEDNSKKNYKGGIIGKAGPFNVSNDTVEEKTIEVRVGLQNASFVFESTAQDKKKATVEEIVKDLNTNFKKIENKEIFLKAIVENVMDRKCVKVISTKPLPFYTPISFSGTIASILGLHGYILTEEVKSVKHDFEKEQGKSVDITSGHGIRCSIKEADKIKGINLTFNLAGENLKILSTISGYDYNSNTEGFFYDKEGGTPSFAFIYFVKAFKKGENNEDSFEKIKVVCYPCCQASIPGGNAQEGAFSEMEIQAFCSRNAKTELPIMFHQTLPIADYNKYVKKV